MKRRQVGIEKAFRAPPITDTSVFGCTKRGAKVTLTGHLARQGDRDGRNKVGN